MKKNAFEELNKELLERVEEYSEEAVKYMGLFMIACGLLDLYKPIPNGMSWVELILANHNETKKRKYS